MSVPALLDKLEETLLQHPQVECPITHHHVGGIYVREMFAPAGTFLIGQEHITHHACMLLKGKMRMLGDNGSTSDVEAPLIFEAKPGRKAAVALTDVVFCNLHPNPDDERDLSKLEAKFVVKSEAFKLAEAKKTLKEAK